MYHLVLQFYVSLGGTACSTIARWVSWIDVGINKIMANFTWLSVWEFQRVSCFSLFLHLQTYHSRNLPSNCLDKKVALSKCSSWCKILFWPIVHDLKTCTIHCWEALETLCRASKLDDDNVTYSFKHFVRKWEPEYEFVCWF